MEEVCSEDACDFLELQHVILYYMVIMVATSLLDYRQSDMLTC